MLRRGYVRVGHYRGAPVLVHLTTPIGLWFLSGFELVPVVWLGAGLLVLMHELGHAAMVRVAGARVQRVEILPFGGRCAWSGQVTPLGRACIAFAGIWVQLILFIAASVIDAYLRRALSDEGRQFLDVFIKWNFLLMAVNLIPVAPLDGEEAWMVFPLLARKLRGTVRRRTLKAKVPRAKPESAPSRRTYLN